MKRIEKMLEEREIALRKRLYDIAMHCKENNLSLDKCKKELLKELKKEEDWLKYIEEHKHVVEE